MDGHGHHQPHSTTDYYYTSYQTSVFTPKEKVSLKELFGRDLFSTAYSSKKDLKEEQVQRILTRVKPSMRRWLKTADILPFLKKRCVLMESEIQHLKTEALAPEEQSMRLIDYLMNKGSYGIAALYCSLVDSSDAQGGVPAHHQLAGELQEVVQSECGICEVECDPVKSLTNGVVDHTQQGLQLAIRNLSSIDITTETAKDFLCSLGMNSYQHLVQSKSLDKICQFWISSRTGCYIEELIEALVVTNGLGRYVTRLSLSQKVTTSPGVRNFFLSLGEQWQAIALYLGYDQEEVDVILQQHPDNMENQVTDFLVEWQMPEIGQRTLPLMHNLKKLAGIEEDTARKPMERSDKASHVKMNRHLKTDSTGKPHRSLDTFERFSVRGSSTHSSPYSSLTSGHFSSGSSGNSRSSTREHDHTSGYSSLHSRVSSRNSTGNVSYSPPLNRSGTSAHPSKRNHTHSLNSHTYYSYDEGNDGIQAQPTGSLKPSQMNDLSISDEEDASRRSIPTSIRSEYQQNVLKTTPPSADDSHEKSLSQDSENDDPPNETLQADEIGSQEVSVVSSCDDDLRSPNKPFGVSLGPPPSVGTPPHDKVDTHQHEDGPVLDQHEGDTTSTTQTDKNLGEFRQVVNSDESITRSQTSTESEAPSTNSKTTEPATKQVPPTTSNTPKTCQGQSSSSPTVVNSRAIVSHTGFEGRNENPYPYQEHEGFSDEENGSYGLRVYFLFSGGQGRSTPQTHTRPSSRDLRDQDPVIEELSPEEEITDEAARFPTTPATQALHASLSPSSPLPSSEGKRPRENGGREERRLPEKQFTTNMHQSRLTNGPEFGNEDESPVNSKEKVVAQPMSQLLFCDDQDDLDFDNDLFSTALPESSSPSAYSMYVPPASSTVKLNGNESFGIPLKNAAYTSESVDPLVGEHTSVDDGVWDVKQQHDETVVAANDHPPIAKVKPFIQQEGELNGVHIQPSPLFSAAEKDTFSSVEQRREQRNKPPPAFFEEEASEDLAGDMHATPFVFVNHHEPQDGNFSPTNDPLPLETSVVPIVHSSAGPMEESSSELEARGEADSQHLLALKEDHRLPTLVAAPMSNVEENHLTENELSNETDENEENTTVSVASEDFEGIPEDEGHNDLHTRVQVTLVHDVSPRTGSPINESTSSDFKTALPVRQTLHQTDPRIEPVPSFTYTTDRFTENVNPEVQQPCDNKPITDAISEVSVETGLLDNERKLAQSSLSSGGLNSFDELEPPPITQPPSMASGEWGVSLPQAEIENKNYSSLGSVTNFVEDISSQTVGDVWHSSLVNGSQPALSGSFLNSLSPTEGESPGADSDEHGTQPPVSVASTGISSTHPLEHDPTEATAIQPLEHDPTEATAIQPLEHGPTVATAIQPLEHDPTEATAIQPLEHDPTEATAIQPLEHDPTEATAIQPLEHGPIVATAMQPLEHDPTVATAIQPLEHDPTEATAPETDSVPNQFTSRPVIREGVALVDEHLPRNITTTADGRSKTMETDIFEQLPQVPRQPEESLFNDLNPKQHLPSTSSDITAGEGFEESMATGLHEPKQTRMPEMVDNSSFGDPYPPKLYSQISHPNDLSADDETDVSRTDLSEYQARNDLTDHSEIDEPNHLEQNGRDTSVSTTPGLTSLDSSHPRGQHFDLFSEQNDTGFTNLSVDVRPDGNVTLHQTLTDDDSADEQCMILGGDLAETSYGEKGYTMVSLARDRVTIHDPRQKDEASEEQTVQVDRADDLIERDGVATVKPFVATDKDFETCSEDVVRAIQDPHGMEMLAALLESGANSSSPTESGAYPIHIATATGNPEKMLLLLSKNIDVNAQRTDGKTALHIACICENFQLVQILIEKGADPSLQDNQGYTCLHFKETLESEDIVSYLIHNGAPPDVASEGSHFTPLLVCCFVGGSTFESACVLLNEGARVDGSNLAGSKPLVTACSVGCEQMVDLLLEKGADVNISDQDGNTPLLKAVQNSHTEVAKRLCRQRQADNVSAAADINQSNLVYQTPLMAAVSTRNKELVKDLLKRGANVNASRVAKLDLGGYGNRDIEVTALSDAAMSGVLEIVQMLIDYRAEVNSTSEMMLSPICFAIVGGHVDIVELLIKQNDIDRSLNGMARPFTMAVDSANLPCVRLLLDRYDGGIEKMLEDAIRHGMDELVQHIRTYQQGGVASPSSVASPTLLASLPLSPVQREASPAGASQTEPSGNGSSFKNRFSEQPARSPPPSANEGETTLSGHPLNAFGNQGGAGNVPLPGKPLNQFDDSDDEEDTQCGGGSTSESEATAMSMMDFGKPLNEFNEPLPTEHAPANVVGQRSNALMHDHSDEDTPGGQTERPNQALFGQPLTVPPHSTHQAPDKSYGHPLELVDTGGQSTASQPEQEMIMPVSFGRPLQPSYTFGQELDLQANPYAPSPVSPSSEAALATASANTFGQPLADKDHGGEVHSSYRASMERLPPVTQTLPNPSSHSEHAQFSTQTSVSMTMPAVSQVTRTVANDFNIATSGPSSRSTLYTNNLRAYSERETLHEQGVGNNETPYRADVSSNLPSDDYSDDEPPLRARLDPNEEQLSLAQEDDGDRHLFAPRLKTPPPERPPSPTTSGRPFHSLQAPETLQGTGMEVLHEFAQICISAASKTRGQEKLMEMASSSGHDHLASFFIGYFFNAAEFSRGGKLVAEFIGGSPSPLNFLISKSLATKASFEAVLSEMGKQDFPDQLLLALHQFPGSDHLPPSGQAMVNALFNHTFVIGSIDTSNSQQDPNGRLQELLRNLNDRSPTPPPPKPYSGPPQETKYEFPAEGGHRLGTQGDDTQKDGTVPPSKNDVASNAPPATSSESERSHEGEPGQRSPKDHPVPLTYRSRLLTEANAKAMKRQATKSPDSTKPKPQSMPRDRRSPVKLRDSNTEETKTALKRSPVQSSPPILQSNSGTALAGSISDAESTTNSFSQRSISPTPSRTSQPDLQKQLGHVTSFTAEPPNVDARLSKPSPIKAPHTGGMYHPNFSQMEGEKKDTDLQNDWTSTGLSALSSTGSQENDRFKPSPPLLPLSELTTEYNDLMAPEDDHMTAFSPVDGKKEFRVPNDSKVQKNSKRDLESRKLTFGTPLGKGDGGRNIVPSLHTGNKDKQVSPLRKHSPLSVKQEKRVLTKHKEFEKDLPKDDSEERVSKETLVEDTTETSPTTNEDWNDLGAADDLEPSTLTSAGNAATPPPPMWGVPASNSFGFSPPAVQSSLFGTPLPRNHIEQPNQQPPTTGRLPLTTHGTTSNKIVTSPFSMAVSSTATSPPGSPISLTMSSLGFSVASTLSTSDLTLSRPVIPASPLYNGIPHKPSTMSTRVVSTVTSIPSVSEHRVPIARPSGDLLESTVSRYPAVTSQPRGQRLTHLPPVSQLSNLHGQLSNPESQPSNLDRKLSNPNGQVSYQYKEIGNQGQQDSIHELPKSETTPTADQKDSKSNHLLLSQHVCTSNQDTESQPEDIPTSSSSSMQWPSVDSGSKSHGQISTGSKRSKDDEPKMLVSTGGAWNKTNTSQEVTQPPPPKVPSHHISPPTTHRVSRIPVSSSRLSKPPSPASSRNTSTENLLDTPQMKSHKTPSHREITHSRQIPKTFSKLSSHSTILSEKRKSQASITKRHPVFSSSKPTSSAARVDQKAKTIRQSGPVLPNKVHLKDNYNSSTTREHKEVSKTKTGNSPHQPPPATVRTRNALKKSSGVLSSTTVTNPRYKDVTATSTASKQLTRKAPKVNMQRAVSTANSKANLKTVPSFSGDETDPEEQTQLQTPPKQNIALLSSSTRHDQRLATHRQESGYSSFGVSLEEREDERVTIKPRISQTCESKTLSLSGSSVQQPLTVINPLQLSFPNYQIRDKDREKLFHTLAPRIRKWTFLGRYLDIDDETLKEIASSCHFDVERCYQMLCRWRREATYLRLAQGLKDIMREDLYPDLISQIPCRVRELRVDQEREHIDVSEDVEGFVVDLPPTDERMESLKSKCESFKNNGLGQHARVTCKMHHAENEHARAQGTSVELVDFVLTSLNDVRVIKNVCLAAHCKGFEKVSVFVKLLLTKID